MTNTTHPILHAIASHIHISFNCDPGVTFFTALLFLCGLFQWIAVKEQGKQNLFKLRLDFYPTIEGHLLKTARLIKLLEDHLNREKYPNWNIHFMEYKSNINESISKALLESREIYYLFGNKFSLKWDLFFNFARTMIHNTVETTPIDSFREELNILGEKQREVIDICNEKIKLEE